MRDPVMRVRCPKDTDPAREGDHLAIDVRLPLSITVISRLAKVASKCPCGALTVLRTDTKEGER